MNTPQIGASCNLQLASQRRQQRQQRDVVDFQVNGLKPLNPPLSPPRCLWWVSVGISLKGSMANVALLANSRDRLLLDVAILLGACLNGLTVDYPADKTQDFR